MEHTGRPARDLDDADLERQGTYAHATRNWVFLHGTAEQFASHTERMLELEQEYLRRHPKRTWQGAADEPAGVDEATRLRTALRSLVTQAEALLDDPGGTQAQTDASDEAVAALLGEVGEGPGGRLHRLEVHQAARRHGVPRAALAGLYKGGAPLLVAEGADRVLTDAGRSWLGARTGLGT
jgi:GNAT superfamily N-acetyltransferase